MRPEDTHQASVATYLAAALPRDSWWTATANGAWLGGDKRRRKMQISRMQRTGVKFGTPDVLIVTGGRFLAIELKVGKNKASDNQADALDAIVAAGGEATIARSVDDVANFLTACKVPLRASIGSEA